MQKYTLFILVIAATISASDDDGVLPFTFRFNTAFMDAGY